MVVDDEKEIADLLKLYLKNDGYNVYKFYKGIDALKCVESEKMDLAILDVMLPDVDGFHICQKIREQYFYPIIMLTAKVEDADKIMGLTIGADADGKTYNLGDEYNGSALRETDVTLDLKEPVKLTAGSQVSEAGRASFSDNIGAGCSYAMWKKVSGGIEIVDFYDADTVYKAKLSGSTLTVICPAGSEIQKIVMVKM